MKASTISKRIMINISKNNRTKYDSEFHNLESIPRAPDNFVVDVLVLGGRITRKQSLYCIGSK